MFKLVIYPVSEEWPICRCSALLLNEALIPSKFYWINFKSCITYWIWKNFWNIDIIAWWNFRGVWNLPVTNLNDESLRTWKKKYLLAIIWPEYSTVIVSQNCGQLETKIRSFTALVARECAYVRTVWLKIQDWRESHNSLRNCLQQPLAGTN